MLTGYLGYAMVCVKQISRIFTENNKQQLVEAAREFFEAYGTDGEEYLDFIVIGDETWVHNTTSETKKQSCQLKANWQGKLGRFISLHDESYKIVV